MDQYKRLIKVIGEDNLTKLMNARVLLVGIGGVGGSSLEMLARSGILNITVIDYDKFEITNLNRQVISLQNNIGKYKVDVIEERISKAQYEISFKDRYDYIITNNNLEIAIKNIQSIIEKELKNKH